MWDETLPDGETVDEAVTRINDPAFDDTRPSREAQYGRSFLATPSIAEVDTSPTEIDWGWDRPQNYTPDLTAAPSQQDFVLPYPTPQNALESARNAFALNEYNISNPQNKDKGVKGFIKELLQNFGHGLSQTPRGAGWKEALLLGGANAGAGIANRSWNEKRKAEGERERLLQNLSYQEKATLGDAQRENIRIDNERMDQQAKDVAEWRKSENIRKTDDRASRERTSRMNAVAGMFKNLPAYDPNNPQFQELTAALGDVGLPITPKDAKKKVDLKQDQRTGLWTVILTDPVSGKQEVRNVIKDGKPFASTPTVVMQGEYGMLKQNDAQDFQAGENEKNRVERRDMFLKGLEQKIRSEQAQLAGDMTKYAQWQAEWIRKIQTDLKDGKLDQDTADAMLQLVK